MAKKSPAKKPRYKSPWPRGSRINRKNDPIAAFPDDHPAKRLLPAHSRCWRECVQREIAWPGHEDDAFDQEWTSRVEQGPSSFSGLIYTFVCFELILTEWLTHPSEITADERGILQEHLPRVRNLLAECQAAADQDKNTRVLELLPLPEAFFNACGGSNFGALTSS
jgi:hypothetical protein